MAGKKTLKKILATVCFECCHNDHNTGGLGLLCRPNGNHPALGEKVELDGRCKGCPVAVLRGDGAPINSGKPSSVFTNQLVPGKGCVAETDWLTANDLSKACRQCEYAAKTGHLASWQELAHCALSCPVWEIRDALQDGDAEAVMS